MFRTRDFYIVLYDRVTNLISFPYELDNGRRVHAGPIEFGKGVTTRAQRAAPIPFGTRAEQFAHGGFEGTYAEGEVPVL